MLDIYSQVHAAGVPLPTTSDQLCRHHLEQLAAIDLGSFNNPRTVDDFLRCMEAGCHGKVILGQSASEYHTTKDIIEKYAGELWLKRSGKPSNQYQQDADWSLANALVRKIENQVLGGMLYYVIDKQLTLVNFAVSPHFRRLGIGTQLIQLLFEKLWQSHLELALVRIGRTNLIAQMFFQRHGFRLREDLPSSGTCTNRKTSVMTFMPGVDIKPISIYHCDEVPTREQIKHTS